MITGFYTGLLGLILLLLIVRIIIRRRRYRVGLGDGGIPDLAQAMRVHGNFTETVPFLIILLGLLEWNQAPEWSLHVFGILAVVSRCLHAYGITASPLVSFGRGAGMITTLGLIFSGSAALIFLFAKN